MANQYKHIFLSGNVISEKFKTKGLPITPRPLPIRDRAEHSAMLLRKFDAIWEEKERLNQQRSAERITTREGTYISFLSGANYDLITKSLEDIRAGIRLLNITQISQDEATTQIRATVYIPKGKEAHFIDKIKKYQSELTPKGEPKNASLVNSIEDVSFALLESLWTDDVRLIPTVNSKWCEAWLNVNTKDQKEESQIAIFKTTLENIGIEYKNNSIIFPERAVLLINADKDRLVELMMQSDLLAEFRAGQEPAGFWMNESSIAQQSWVEDLLRRIELVDSNVKVCVLDTGVNNGHQLLQPLLNNADTLTVEPAWGTNDHDQGRGGHGTLMAGIAGYGKLEEVLATNKAIVITHKLCSVKILPPPTQSETPEQLWGDVTSQAISRAEIQNPEMVLIYCMAVTSAGDIHKGRPSSWSGAIDKLIFGDGENQKLILISAGNIDSLTSWQNYPFSNFQTSIENPAQSWNALTIGAYTEKDHINNPNYRDYAILANKGELSPYSRTSVMWEKRWPIKPDVVFEGGNLLLSPDHSISSHEDLELLSTSKTFNIMPFGTINATSAATAQASWYAAKIAYEYPNAWPETIRGLMVHSANWNEAMMNQVGIIRNTRKEYHKLLKTFGYGSPDLDKALYSRESSLTFVSQEEIQPFGFNSRLLPEINEIHIFNLPWPEELLLSMSEIPVKLKITLSYFIQPGAGDIGWKDKYRYQSHGLRFDVNNVGESEDVFRKRINVAAREEDEQVSRMSGSDRWVIGKDNRSHGSIHSDYWEGTAAALATCHCIAVYPIIGWWRERKHLGLVENKTRYSLIVSLETPAQDVELYTTVKNLIDIPIEIAIN